MAPQGGCPEREKSPAERSDRRLGSVVLSWGEVTDVALGHGDPQAERDRGTVGGGRRQPRVPVSNVRGGVLLSTRSGARHGSRRLASSDRRGCVGLPRPGLASSLHALLDRQAEYVSRLAE